MKISHIFVFSERRAYIGDIGPCVEQIILLASVSLFSGRRESNPLYMTPSHAYYHYTTARDRVMSYVGPPGIEPGLYEPESYVLPVYYGPTKAFIRVRSTGLEPVTSPV